MKTKNLMTSAMLLALGAVLHYVVPGIVNGVKPDFLLATAFLAILLAPNLKNTLAVAGASAILAALTTTFPGGQIPSLIDKLVSCIAVYAMIKSLPVDTTVGKGVLFFFGTVISGFAFLASASALVGLPGGVGIGTMMAMIVLPTSGMNVVLGLVLTKIFQRHLKEIKSY